MRILGIDPGLSACGFALMRFTQGCPPKVLVLHTVRTKPELENYERKELIAGPALNTQNIDLMVTEDVLSSFFGAQFRGHANADSLQPTLVMEMMRGIAYARGIPFMALTPGQVRKRLGLPQKASKQDIWRAVELRLQAPLSESSEHARDGAGIAVAGQIEFHAQKYGLK